MDFAGSSFEMVVNDESIEKTFSFTYPHIAEPRHDYGKINNHADKVLFKMFPSKKISEISGENHKNKESDPRNEYRKQTFCQKSPSFEKIKKI